MSLTVNRQESHSRILDRSLTEAKALMKVLKTLPYNRRRYWKVCIITHWWLATLPTVDIFKKWLITDHWPYSYRLGEAIRKQFWMNGISIHRAQFTIYEVKYPFSFEKSISDKQYDWVVEYLKNDKRREEVINARMSKTLNENDVSMTSAT